MDYISGIVRLCIAGGLLVLVASILAVYLSSHHTWSSWTLPLSGKIIALDPGHGGPDGGAVSRDGLVEKDVNLKIALYLRDYLQEAGALVVMTRESDHDLADSGSKRRKTQDLHRRADLIRRSNADLFVTIHMNAIASSRWHGAQTFYDGGADEESRKLAQLIQEELVRNLENTNRVAKSVQNIYLLRTASMPSALVEVGFLSNPGEARLLGNELYQRKVAASIYRGILRYSAGETPG